MKNGGEQWQVDDDLLTETGRGGLFTDGYLQGEPLVSYFDSTETPLFVFGSGKRGVTRIEGEETERIVPASGYRAVTALTDRRVQFVVGGGDSNGDWAADIRLTDVDRVTVDEGLIRSRLTIYSDGVQWKIHLKDVSADRIVSFLEDVSWAWIQVEELIGDARMHLVDATQHHKSREYDGAHASLAQAREKLDEASDVAGSLAEEASTGIRERISQIESRYRETKRRAHASEATHLVDEAERHWRNDRFAAAYEAYETAREQYETVLDIYGLEPDKADAMRDRIDHVEHNLDALASAPLEHADEARARALDSEDVTERLGHWQAALEEYRRTLELDWGKDHKRFEGDVDLLRDRAAEAVEGILDARRTLADDYQQRGDEHIEAEAVGEAREAFSEAMTHLEHAHQLAHEFDPEAATDIERRLEMLGDCISNATASVSLTYEGGADSDSEFDPEAVDVADFEPDSSESRDDADTPVEDDATGSGEDDDYDDFDNWVTLAPDETDSSDAETDEPASSDAETDEPAPEDTERVEPEDSPDTPEVVPVEGIDGAVLDNSEPEPTPEHGEEPTGPLADRLADVELPLAESGASVPEPVPDEQLVERIEQLETRALLEVVEAMWDAMGWSVTASADVVEISREQPTATTRVLTVVATDAVAVTDIEQCLLGRDTREADGAVLIASVPVDEEADRRAMEADVEVLSADELAALVQREGLDSLLPDAAA